MMRQITLPDDLYSQLQGMAVPFEDHEPADVIRKLLSQIQNSDTTPNGEESRTHSDLMSRGGIIPHGTKLRRRSFKGRSFEAEVLDGAIWLDGQAYSSPSEVAIEISRSIGAKSRHINGWRFWEYFDSVEGIWKPLDELRAR